MVGWMIFGSLGGMFNCWGRDGIGIVGVELFVDKVGDGDWENIGFLFEKLGFFFILCFSFLRSFECFIFFMFIFRFLKRIWKC